MSGVMDPNHAILVGAVAGLCAKAEDHTPKLIHKSHLPPKDDDGLYENYFIIEQPSGKYRVTITPEDGGMIEV